MIKLDYLMSVLTGLFTGSLILFISRVAGFPVTGVIVAVVLSTFVAAFLYNPYERKGSGRGSLRCTMAGILLCFIFSVVLTMYYIPQFNSMLSVPDLAFSVSAVIIVAFTVIGGLLVGSVGGSLGAAVRKVVSVVTFERK